ncbi:MAG: ParM/StbA family protein [Ruminococcus flavefaciens]|nr:ParM/StbA family protein [Ruminococcus flavefaciens]
MKTTDYRTRTEIKAEKHAACQSRWPIALDIGYSGVKGYSPNSLFCFPSYAKKIGKKKDVIGLPAKDEILYHDLETDDVWRVGASAQKSTSMNDTSDSQSELFGRHRYSSSLFKVIARTGLGFGMMNTSCGAYSKLPCCLQTGLPPAYLKGPDRQELVGTLSGRHRFVLQVGDKAIPYDFTLKAEDIDVMAQPEGTLMSLSMDDNCRSVRAARDYFSSNLLIADAGFETLDLYELYNRTIRGRETFTSYGMREIMKRTCDRANEKYQISLDQTSIQNVLETGEVVLYKPTPEDRRPHRVAYPIDGILEEVVKDVCSEAVDKIMDTFDGLGEYKYLVLTGGTFAPWEDMIRDYFSGMDSLTILMGNENCREHTDLIYTNARGYYLYMVSRLRRAEAGAKR